VPALAKSLDEIVEHERLATVLTIVVVAREHFDGAHLG
jgi:hypothetical protein